MRVVITNHELNEAERELRKTGRASSFLARMSELLQWLGGSSWVAVCEHGAHRSAILAVIVLIMTTGDTLKDVADYVEKMRWI